MDKITDLRPGKSGAKRVNVFLNGKFAFSLQAKVAIEKDLQIGQELSPIEIEALTREERFQCCLDAATRYLSYRPRSEAEIREKLSRRGFGDDSIQPVMDRLKEQKLLDDAAFAEFWAENRQEFSPRSQRLTILELRRKGISPEIAERAANTVNDSDSAYRAALSKAQRLPVSDQVAFRRRLGEYLRRRGFSYEVANQAVDKAWQELTAADILTTHGSISSECRTISISLNNSGMLHKRR